MTKLQSDAEKNNKIEQESKKDDGLKIYCMEKLPNVLDAVMRYIQTCSFTGRFTPLKIDITPPKRTNYEKFYLLFEPDLLDPSHTCIRMYGMAPLKWDPSYGIKRELVKGTKEEILTFLATDTCRKEVMCAIIDFDKSERHREP